MDPALSAWVKREGVLLREERTFGVYRLQPRTVHDDKKNKVRVLALGPENELEVKSVLLLGETGTGKTLFLNSILNRIFGVGFEDDVRLQLKDQMDAEEKSMIKSQTEYTTAYTIYYQDGMQHKYNFMIIDTPGFGDTEGKDADNRHCLRFYLADETWITHLNSVAVFFKMSDNRCTKEKKQIVQTIKDLLGFDIKYLIDIMITFSPLGDTEDSVNLIDGEGLPYHGIFPFDNVYINRSVPEDKRSKNRFVLLWDMMTENQDEYLDALTKRKPMSLNITKNLINSMIVAEETERKLDELQKEKQKENETLIKLKTRIAQLEQEANEVDMSKIDEMSKSGREMTIDNDTHAHCCSTCEEVCLVECTSRHQFSLWEKPCDNTGKGVWGQTKGFFKKIVKDLDNKKTYLTFTLMGLTGGVVTLGAILAPPVSGAIALGVGGVELAGWTTMLSSVAANTTALVKALTNDDLTREMHRNDGEKECPHCGHWGLDHTITKKFNIKDASSAMLVELLKKEQFQKVVGKMDGIEEDIRDIKQKLKEIETTEKQERERKENAEKEKKFLKDGVRSSE